MIIGVDGNEANVSQRVGVSVYTANILEYFQRHAGPDMKFLVFLKQKPLPNLPGVTEFFKYHVIPSALPLWSQTILPLKLHQMKLFRSSLDVFFSPAHYIPRFCPFPSVVTIHDLSYFYYPEEFLKKDLVQLKQWTEYSVKRSRKIIAVSKTTKKDLSKWYGIPEDAVEVIYNGYEKNNIKETAIDISQKNQKYILFVGTIQPRKNLTTLIKTFGLFQKENPEFKLIIAGKKGWLFKQTFEQVEASGLGQKVIFSGYVTDSELVSLYGHAFCLVLPSLYEGFGIPILEAMSYGCPVLSSFASSLPEIGGDACLYFDPKDEKDIYDKLNRLKNSNDLRKELIQKGKGRIREFSWERCGQQTLEVLKNAIP